MRSSATNLPPPLALPDLLRQGLLRTPRSRHLGWREAGYWRWLSTEEVAREVRRAALGFHTLGVRTGTTVALCGASSPHWLIADLAIQTLGAVSVPMFSNLAPEHAAYEIAHSRVRLLVALGDEGEAFAAQHLARLCQVVVRGATHPRRGMLPWEELCRRGDELCERDPGLYARFAQADAPDRLATIIFTSGSTGMPKGVELTHGNLLAQVEAALACFPLDPATDRALSCLPLAHVFERMVIYAYLAAGIPVWFADDVRQAGVLMREARPTIMTMVPRLVEKLYDRIAQGVDTAWVGKRALGRWAMREASRSDPDAGSRPMGLRVSDGLVFQRVRAVLGGCLRHVIVGGAALESRFERFLRNIGVPVSVGYGLTEAGPVVTVNCDAARRSATVGKPFPGVEVRLVEGEILVRGPGVMRGYHRDPAASRAVLVDGWLRTGDLGSFDADGFLRVTGRIKELCKTSNGKYVSMLPIEQALERNPAVDHACVVADGRPFVTALIFLGEDAVRQHAPGGRPDAELEAEIARQVAEANRGLDAWMQVRRWSVVAHPAAIGVELTPTLKLRRGSVTERYRDLIDRLYAGGGAS